MKQDTDQISYHNFLGVTKETLDPVLTKMRRQDLDRWVGVACAAPFKKLPSIFKSLGALGKLSFSTLPVIGPGLVILFSVIKSWPLWIPFSLISVIIIILYCILVQQYISKMISIASEHFHLGALKAKRPKEYELWAPLINHNATYSTLYDYVGLVFKADSDKSLREALGILNEQSLQNRNEDYALEIEYLENEIVRHEKAISYLVGLIKDTNKSLYRFVNDCMNFYELDFVCGYTIYEIKDGHIIKIMDKGTSGSSPSKLPLTKENALIYSAVDVAMHPEEGTKYNNSSPGRTVVSSYMRMLDGANWVWCFHFDDTNDKALYLALGDDIIEVREVYRLIHVFCLILQKASLSGKEEILDGNERSSDGDQSTAEG